MDTTPNTPFQSNLTKAFNSGSRSLARLEVSLELLVLRELNLYLSKKLNNSSIDQNQATIRLVKRVIINNDSFKLETTASTKSFLLLNQQQVLESVNKSIKKHYPNRYFTTFQ